MKVDRKHLIIPLALFSFVHCIDRFVLLLVLNGLILGVSGLFLVLDRWLELGPIDRLIVRFITLNWRVPSISNGVLLLLVLNRYSVLKTGFDDS